MAPANAQPVGKVFIVYGTVKAVSPGGVERVLTPNSPVYAHEQIVTGPDGSVSITLANNGGKLDLGRMSEVLLDQDVYGAGGQAGATDAVAEVKDIQAALENGNIDPTTGLPAPAAGPGVAGAGGAGGAAGGGRQIVVFEVTHMEVTPDSGADTTGITRNFLDPPPGGQSTGDPGTIEPPGPPIVPYLIQPVVTTVNEANLWNGTNPNSGLLTQGGSLLDQGVRPGSALDFGNGQTITIDGNPDNSLVVHGDYGDLTIKGDGTWTYELKENTDHPGEGKTGQDDEVKDPFSFTATDPDGNTADSSVVAHVYDDGPRILDVTPGAVYEADFAKSADGTITTTGKFDISYGEDGFGGLELSAKGATWNGKDTLTADDGSWEVKVNEDGTGYTFTQLKPMDHTRPDTKDYNTDTLELNITLKVTDHDGDSASKDFTITVHDDGPSLDVGNAEVWEHGLVHSPDGISQDGILKFSYGADDGKGSLVLKADNATWIGNTLTDNNGAWQLVVNVDENGNYTGTYTFTQFEALTHPDPTKPHEPLNIDITAVVTDGDNDSMTGHFTVTVFDDAPRVWHTPDNTTLSNTAGASDTGHLYLTFGTDEAASHLPLQLGDKGGNILTDGQSVVDMNGNALTSGGHSLVYEVDPNTGVVNAVFTDDGGVKHTAFSVSLDAEHKTYTVAMGDSPLDLVHQVTTDFSQGPDNNGNFDFGDMNVHVTGTYNGAGAPVTWDSGLGVGYPGDTTDNVLALKDELTMVFQDKAGHSQTVESAEITLAWQGAPCSAYLDVYNGDQYVTVQIDWNGKDASTVYDLQGIGPFDKIVFRLGENDKTSGYQIKSLTVDQADQDPVLSYTAIATDGDGDHAHTDVFHVTFHAADDSSGTLGIVGASAMMASASASGGVSDHGFHHEGSGDGFGGGDHDALGSLLGDHHQHNSGGGHHA